MYTFGSISINLGANIVRLSHVRDSRTFFCIGYSFFALGNLANFAALNLAAQSLLEALGAVQFLSNLAFARLVQGDTVRVRDLLSSMLIVCGNILVLSNGSHRSHSVTFAELPDLVSNPSFIIYMATAYTTALILLVLRLRATSLSSSSSSFSRAFSPDCPSGAIASAVCSALIGSNSVLLGKTTVGLLQNAMLPHPQGEVHAAGSVGGDISSWRLTAGVVVLLLWVVHIVYWLVNINRSLKKYSPLFIIPVLQSTWILCTVIGGGLFFKEFDSLSRQQVVSFSSGIAVVCVGVIMLTIGSSSTFEATAAAAASAASGVNNRSDRAGGCRAYISVADEGDDSESIFTAADATITESRVDGCCSRFAFRIKSVLDHPIFGPAGDAASGGGEEELEVLVGVGSSASRASSQGSVTPPPEL